MPFSPCSTISPSSPDQSERVLDDFHERQVSANCALHAIHNLLRSADITVKEMNEMAIIIAKEAGDIESNHVLPRGHWSIDTAIRTLQQNGYCVTTGIKTYNANGKPFYKWGAEETMYQILENPHALGFIIHERNHYTAYRKNKTLDNWEYSDSMACSPQNLSPYEFCKQALSGSWNIYLVTK